MRCLVLHPDGICPGPYGKCDCSTMENNQPKSSCCGWAAHAGFPMDQSKCGEKYGCNGENPCHHGANLPEHSTPAERKEERYLCAYFKDAIACSGGKYCTVPFEPAAPRPTESWEEKGERADYFEPDAIVFPKSVVSILLEKAEDYKACCESSFAASEAIAADRERIREKIEDAPEYLGSSNAVNKAYVLAILNE